MLVKGLKEFFIKGYPGSVTYQRINSTIRTPPHSSTVKCAFFSLLSFNLFIIY